MRPGKSKPQITADENAERIFTEAFDSLPDGATKGLIEAALEIARERESTLLNLKDALERNDLIEAKRLINQLVPSKT